MILVSDSHVEFKGLDGGRGWTIAQNVLLVIWVVAAATTMYPALGKAIGLRGTFFSSYAADLANPPWIYIMLRRGRNSLARFVAQSPASAALSIFAVGAISEICQKVWPGFINGAFDPADIAAYGLGLLMCYVIESRTVLSSAR